MSNTARIGIVAALALVVGTTLAFKQKNQASRSESGASSQDAGRPGVAQATTASDAARTLRPEDTTQAPVDRPLPRLVDLGATKCIPCKQMAPILEALEKDYAGRMIVEFIDVWENPNAGDVYQVRMIPTQIFYDASGKELFRHEGFYSREDILGKWKELGVDVESKPTSAGQVN